MTELLQPARGRSNLTASWPARSTQGTYSHYCILSIYIHPYYLTVTARGGRATGTRGGTGAGGGTGSGAHGRAACMPGLTALAKGSEQREAHKSRAGEQHEQVLLRLHGPPRARSRVLLLRPHPHRPTTAK